MFRIILTSLVITTLASAELPDNLFVDAAPSNAVEVLAARATPLPGTDITVRGVIGGRTKPFVDGRAVFTLIDRSLVCDTACGTGWSGCGNPPEVLRAGLAVVQVSDGNGKPIAVPLAGAGKLSPGSTVVVKGSIAQGSTTSVLIVSATAIHLESLEKSVLTP